MRNTIYNSPIGKLYATGINTFEYINHKFYYYPNKYQGDNKKIYENFGIKVEDKTKTFNLVRRIARLYGKDIDFTQSSVKINNEQLYLYAQTDEHGALSIMLDVSGIAVDEYNPQEATRPKQPLFKGFSTETNSWHYGCGWYDVSRSKAYVEASINSDKAILYTDSSPIVCELASMVQYTGVTINKQKIFNQDIIQINNAGVDFEMFTPENRVVEYHDGKYILYKGNDMSGGLELIHIEDCDIIGTVYGNPELTKY